MEEINVSEISSILESMKDMIFPGFYLMFGMFILSVLIRSFKAVLGDTTVSDRNIKVPRYDKRQYGSVYTNKYRKYKETHFLKAKYFKKLRDRAVARRVLYRMIFEGKEISPETFLHYGLKKDYEIMKKREKEIYENARKAAQLEVDKLKAGYKIVD